MLITKGKYITAVSQYNTKCVADMLLEHYDTYEYNNTLFWINLCDDTYNQDKVINFSEFNCNRKIYYYLEHGNSGWMHHWPGFKECIANNFDELWSFEDNVNGLDEVMDFKIMPMRYTHLSPYKINCNKPTTDIGFVGICYYEWAPYRGEFFKEYTEKYRDKFSLKILNGKPIDKFIDELSDCKFILDMPRVKWFEQNQVRIFECICRGYHVLSRKSELNYFPGLITEWKDISELNELIHTIKPQDFSEKYKEMTYTNKAFEEYKNKLLIK